ncbi:MAG: histidinol-phosphatase [Eubacterium sp.]|nr:histidinol-phosphatase [Eubacterium sp.]
MFNLHTHTKRCHHAQGSDEEYVIKAIENGYDVLGFSDHAPHLFPNGEYVSNCRMLPSEAEEYAKSIYTLKEKYKDQIDIKLGYEMEWYPELIEKDIKFLKDIGYDYLLLAQHFTDNEYEDFASYCGHPTNSIEVVDKYINQLLEGAKSGLFTYVCHPDLINYKKDKEVYFEKLDYMLTELKKLDIPLEYNFYGYFDNRHYPNPDFWKMAKEKDMKVAIGLDAHNPKVIEDKKRLDKMKKEIAEIGIKPLETIELIK